MEVKDNLTGITNCPICFEMYTDPKIVSCLHTFCAKCLEATASKACKKPEDDRQCPLCRKIFSIPREGFAKLQQNLFVERLVMLRRILNMKDGSCNVCMANESTSATKASSVQSYCYKCSLNLCANCSRHHSKSKLTKTHKLVVVDDQSITAERMEMFASTQCDLHEDEELKLYCIACKRIICALCYIESHQEHTWLDVKTTAEVYRKRLLENLGVISTCMHDAQCKQRTVEESKQEIYTKIGIMKYEVEKRRRELSSIVDKHAGLVVRQLDSLKESTIQEIGKEMEDIEQHYNCMDSFVSYVNEFADKAAAVDICRDGNSINERATELKKASGNIIQRQHSPFNVSFRKTDLQEFVGSDSCNILGTIQDKKVITRETPKGRTAEDFKELLVEIGQLKRETETEKSNSRKHLETINTLNQELVLERTTKNEWMITEKQLREKVKQFEQELLFLNQKTATVQTEHKKHQETISTLNQELIRERTTKNEWMTTEKQLREKVKQLEQEILLLNQKTATVQTEHKKHQETIKILNQELVIERTTKNERMTTEKQLREKVKQLEQEILLLNQKTATVQKQLDDERKEKIKLDTEIQKCKQNEEKFVNERSAFATKEKNCNEVIQLLACQERESSQMMEKLKQQAADSERILGAENYSLQEQKYFLQAELQSFEIERDSLVDLITKERAMQQKERNTRTAIEDQLKSVTSQLRLTKEAELQTLLTLGTHKNEIQELKETLMECNRTITNFQERQTGLEKLLLKWRPDVSQGRLRLARALGGITFLVLFRCVEAGLAGFLLLICILIISF